MLLSICMGVGGCGCPISFKIKRMVRACRALRNNAPNSASATDAATNLKVVHVM